MQNKAKVAVILSGCGVFDGAEIHESVLTLLALARAGAKVTCAAPDITQRHVINHATGEEIEDEDRNVLEEAARILKPGGQLIIIDLLEHQFEKAHDLYADVWLGFSENKLYQFLKEAGFRQIEINVVAREDEEPNFQTVLASGVKG